MISITKILVATDLTDRSNRALERALQLKRETGAELTLLHVVKPGLPTEIASRQRKDADAFLRVTPNVQHAVLVGDTFITITQEAAKQRADLIVVGEPGKYRYDNLFVGTTAERVIRFSDRPVLVVKRVPHGPYDRVLVAFDMSEGATRALNIALKIAPDAEFRAVHAWWAPIGTLGAIEVEKEAIRKENEDTKARIRTLIEHAANQALVSAPKTKLTIDMIENNPYVVMRNEIGWPDLLTIGTHAKGKLATNTIGKLARHLLCEATCDILVARP